MIPKALNIWRGFTVAELLIAIGIISAVALAVSDFQRNVFFWNKAIQGSLNAQLSARAALREFSSETRESSVSALGAYPIAEASPTAFTYYSDLDNDGRAERVRYYLQGTQLRKGVVSPSGSPLSYNVASERVETVIGDVANGAMPIFEYFDGMYGGASTPLSSPFQISSVRLVKMTLAIDADPNRAPDPLVFTTQVSIRNLKDNL